MAVRQASPRIRFSTISQKDFLCIIDESHVTVPQIRGMHEGDRSRKVTLAEHGFRLPSCLDNRPLRFDEFEQRVPQFIYVSATPGDYEEKVSQQQVEQIIRPTGLLDPDIDVRPICEPNRRHYRRSPRARQVLTSACSLPRSRRQMAEDLTDHLLDQGIRARYMHSDIAHARARRDSARFAPWRIRRAWWASICCARASICPKCRSWLFLTPIKRAFCATTAALFRLLAVLRETINGQCDYVCRQDHRLHGPKPSSETRRRREYSDGLQRRARHSAPNRQEGLSSDVTGLPRIDGDGDQAGSAARGQSTDLAGYSRSEIHACYSLVWRTSMMEASAAMDFERAASVRDQIVQLRGQMEGKSEEAVLGELKKTARKGSAFGARKSSYGGGRKS